MKDIFISYSHKQKGLVNELVNQLEKNGINPWTDDKIETTSSDWRLDIDKAIDESLLFLVVMTKDANESPYVTFEWAYAMGRNKPIALLARDNTINLHPRLSTCQKIPFTDAEFDLDEIVSTIKSILNTLKLVAQQTKNENDLSTNKSKENLLKSLLELLTVETLKPIDLFVFAMNDVITLDERRTLMDKLEEIHRL